MIRGSGILGDGRISLVLGLTFDELKQALDKPEGSGMAPMTGEDFGCPVLPLVLLVVSGPSDDVMLARMKEIVESLGGQYAEGTTEEGCAMMVHALDQGKETKN